MAIGRGDMVKRAAHGRTVGRVTGVDVGGQWVYVEWERPHRYTQLTRRWEPVSALVKVEDTAIVQGRGGGRQDGH